MDLDIHSLEKLEQTLRETTDHSGASALEIGLSMMSPAGLAMVSPAGLAFMSPAGLAMMSPAGLAFC